MVVLLTAKDMPAMNSSSNIITVIMVGLIGGVAVGLQGPMSGAMSQRLGPLGASLIIHVGGALLTGLLLIFSGGFDIRNIQGIPIPYLFAGIFGVILYFTFAFTLPKVGASTTTALLILAQLTIGLVLDHFGWMGVPQHPVGIARLLGMGLLIGGAFLVTR
jgi:bacterial/archaeal transporter family-2 protein